MKSIVTATSLISASAVQAMDKAADAGSRTDWGLVFVEVSFILAGSAALFFLGGWLFTKSSRKQNQIKRVQTMTNKTNKSSIKAATHSRKR